MDHHYTPPSTELLRAGGAPLAQFFRDSVDAAIRFDPRTPADWLPAPALHLLHLGVLLDKDPFALCVLAAQHNKPQALDILLDVGYAPRHQPLGVAQFPWTWPTLLHACATTGMLGAIERVAHATPIDSINFMGQPPLLTAAVAHQQEAALLLLRLGANPLAANSSGEGALFAAAIRDLPLLAHELLARGADADALSLNNTTARALAIKHKSEGFLATLEAFELGAHVAPALPARRTSL